MIDDDNGRPYKKIRPLSAAGIAEQNAYLLRRYTEFRLAADVVAAAWRRRDEVAAVSLIGSTASAPWKEVPRFSPYRRADVELWHECKDLDLAVWLTRTNELNILRKIKDKALREMYNETGIGVASHQTDTFVLEFGTDRYLGRLCAFNRCPKEKRECLVVGCGDIPFLQQHQDFAWREDSIAPERSIVLFDRASGQIRRAADFVPVSQ